MLKTQTTGFHFACAVFGIFTALLAFISYLIKERLYISDSFLSFIVGAIAGPATGLFDFKTWAGGETNLEAITVEFTRLSLCVQVLLNGVQLPPKFIKKSWRPLLCALLPGMTLMWLISSLLIWVICALTNGADDEGTHRMPFLHAMAIGACIAPTDPVLASTIVKGRWADQHVPAPLAQLISGESGANDGLGFPFLYLSLYLIEFVGGHGQHSDMEGGAGAAMAHFFGNTIGYMLILGAFWGAVVGYASAKLLKLCRRMQYVDHESFFAFPILIAILLIGTCGMAGSNDILASFFAGCALSWDGWFRERTAQDSFASTLELFLNMALFIYLGAICPWRSFAPMMEGTAAMAGSVSLWRQVCLAVAILVLRRVPVMVLLHQIGLLRPHVQSLRQAAFMGFFGPMGISSIFYLHEIRVFCRDDLGTEEGDNDFRADVRHLYHSAEPIIWFLVVSSVVVHGLAIPSYQAGVFLWTRWRWEEQTHHAKHRFSFRGFARRERLAFQHTTEKLRTEEERIGEHIERDILHHRRPAPTFRKVKDDSG